MLVHGLQCGLVRLCLISVPSQWWPLCNKLVITRVQINKASVQHGLALDCAVVEVREQWGHITTSIYKQTNERKSAKGMVKQSIRSELNSNGKVMTSSKTLPG